MGSNQGDRLKYLNWASEEIKKIGLKIQNKAPIYETQALLPKSVPNTSDWTQAFLNTVLQVSSSNSIKPLELLFLLKKIEKTLGRKNVLKWAPRPIDLDILLFDDILMSQDNLTIPHTELQGRNFVLTPLKELAPLLNFPQSKQNMLQLFRTLKIKLPTWMHIVNVTPDSFSDGGKMNIQKFKTLLNTIPIFQQHIIDLGAESTRPGAKPISSDSEWKRLKPFIDIFFKIYSDKIFRPLLSIDTYHPKTAQRGLAMGVDIINDVSGLSTEMLDILKDSNGHYILMHSLSVPASREKVFSETQNPILEIKKWLEKKLELLNKHGVSLERIIFDPGIGFGKTAAQSLYILKNIKEFLHFPVRLIVGHSRKSFMQELMVVENPHHRDWIGAGMSLALVKKGVDILRVHNLPCHAQALQGNLHIL